MDANSLPHADSLSLSAERRIDAVCRRFEAAWQAREQPSIQPYLDDVPTSERTALLREIIALDLDYRRQAGETPTPDDYRRRFPDQETLVQDVFERAGSLASTGTNVASATDLAPLAPAGGTPRYSALRLHARGGLGEVHVARDAELHRTVALKRMQSRLAGDRESRRRFLVEAEITGRLEHPGIVPVYGLIQDAAGEPAYAMRFVEGETLKEAADRYHAAPDRMAFRQLLTHFVAACNAVAYAHSRGVIHRDLKPANILIGKFGETLVVDWGLAKVVGRVELERHDGEVTLTTAEAPAGEGTALGQAVGTPAYMSPEQAAGRWNVVDQASDVYSLGATLYYLLTGRAPYCGQDKFEVLALVQRGAFTQPRQVSLSVPAALDAVCRRAMALEPKQRYATSQELSSEVDRWLANEPVAAYPEPWTARVGRWTQRHRVLVTGAGAAVAVLALCLGIGAAVLSAANTQLRQKTIDLASEQIRTQEALDAEAKRRKEVREALDAQTSFVMEDLLGRQTSLTKDHEQFLRQALKAYEQFAADTGQEEKSRSGVAHAHMRVGKILARMGARTRALESYGLAIALYAQLAADFPAVPEYRRELAVSRHTLGNVLWDIGERAAAQRAFEEALAIRDKLASDFPTVSEYRQDLAMSHSNRANVLRALKEKRAAQQAYEQALAVQQKLTADFPTEPEYRRELAVTHNNLGNLMVDGGELPAARRAYEQAQVIQQKLTIDFPTSVVYCQDLAASHNNLGNVLRELGERAAARQAYEQSMVLKEKLAADFPTVPEYRQDLAFSHSNLGNLLLDLGEPLAARQAFERAVALQEKLVADSPNVPAYAVTLGGVYINFGNLLKRKSQAAEALGWYAKSIAVIEGALRRTGKDVRARQSLRLCHSSRAHALRELGRHLEAARDWGRVLELNDQPHRQSEFGMERALSLARGGESGRAIAELEPLLRAGAPDMEFLCDAACVFALAAGKVRDPALAGRHVARAIALLREAVAGGYRDFAHLKQDTDLNALRSRPDFQEFIADAEAKVK